MKKNTLYVDAAANLLLGQQLEKPCQHLAATIYDVKQWPLSTITITQFPLNDDAQPITMTTENK